MEEKDEKRFLNAFLPEHAGGVTEFFYRTARTFPEEKRAPRLLCSALYAMLWESVRRWEDSGSISKRGILAVLEEDPEAAQDLMAYVIEQLGLPPSVRQERKEAAAALGKQEWMKRQEPTEKQLAFLARLGYDGPVENRWHASQLIEEHKD